MLYDVPPLDGLPAQGLRTSRGAVQHCTEALNHSPEPLWYIQQLTQLINNAFIRQTTCLLPKPKTPPVWEPRSTPFLPAPGCSHSHRNTLGAPYRREKRREGAAYTFMGASGVQIAFCSRCWPQSEHSMTLQIALTLLYFTKH